MAVSVSWAAQDKQEWQTEYDDAVLRAHTQDDGPSSGAVRAVLVVNNNIKIRLTSEELSDLVTVAQMLNN